MDTKTQRLESERLSRHLEVNSELSLRRHSRERFLRRNTRRNDEYYSTSSRKHENILDHIRKYPDRGSEHIHLYSEKHPSHSESNTNLTEMYSERNNHHRNAMDTNQYAADPFQCRLQIRTSRGEANFLKNLFSPLLEGIDPTFQFINLEEKESFNQPLTAWDQETEGDYDTDGMICPAISIVLFLSEKFGQLSANSVQNYLSSEPWKFHHRIELPKDVRPQITARQDFYQAFHDHPLWSICPVHYGNEHLRFHIVVKDFQSMRRFYENITGIKARDGSPGFCYIPIYSQSGLDIQLSLKCLPQVYPKPLTVARLRFKIPNMEVILPYLVGCPLPMPNEKGAWLTNDPDGNVIILEKTDPMDTRDVTSDYESCSAAETDSNSSSWGPSRNVLRGSSTSRTSIHSDLV